MEVLTAYSHTPELLDDLRKAVDIAHAQGPDELDDTRSEAASRPRPWAMADRLSHKEAQTVIDLYRSGMIAKDVATKFGLSLSSVRRLLRKHNARLSDRD